MDYPLFLENKQKQHVKTGFTPETLNHNLKPFQSYVVKRALETGCFALFSDTGTGKTIMQLEWANQVSQYTNKPVLILAPLAVGGQTIREAKKFDLHCERLKSEVFGFGVYVTNYEQINNIDCTQFSGIVLDESSILKNYNGATKQLIIDRFQNTPFKLACTATPSPNDDLELGNHAEFLNVMSSQDMRAVFFTTEKSRKDGNKYRLKKHGISEFFSWVNSWALMISKPSDIGFDDEGYDLPALNMIERSVSVEMTDFENGQLFKNTNVSATIFNRELNNTLTERMSEVANIVNNEKSNETFLIWINRDSEGEALRKLIPEAIEVKGSDKPEVKESRLLGFANNEFRVLITKKKIAQYGLNFQYVKNPNMIFASLDFSFEGTYQAIRRMYRFGQSNIVNVYLITIATMENVKKSIQEKETNFLRMRNQMINQMNTKKDYTILPIERKEEENEHFHAVKGDSTELIKEIPDGKVDFTFFSPPFSNMYVFSNDIQDLSNCTNYDDFMKHFEFIIPELFRVTADGRMVAMHIMQTTTLKGGDGFYSIVDFRGDVIRLFQKYGFHFHAEITIRKDPQMAAIRTKNHQLMHGTTKKNSLINRPGLADYIIVMRKGKQVDELRPVNRGIPFDVWCDYAEPVWMDVQEGDTVKYRKARDEKDEKHITATQLEPIKRLLMMYTNEGDTCYTPYSGSGSELSQFVKYGCYGIAHELKDSYYKQSVSNAKIAIESKGQTKLF
ncbi:MAG: DNA methylase [Bacteroidetes bacterium]|nr:MAG: DNA methylase [Bacteroidota bacterium]